ncbi:MAG: threonyl-tRNA synthetase editing domain-containing protein [Candidatus Sabulitectum sp.]|nr:threonyl-tRNA synthetase editing domain-containing protein [Candidatus Sabulitectum sp.]
MKLLIIYCDTFAYITSIKNLESVEEYHESKSVTDALVGFIQVEQKDEDTISGVETKLVKNLKWAAKKNNTKRIVLHSFAHLSTSKADETITLELFNRAEERLNNAGYETSQTPFGYFLDLNVQAPGKSLARVFKEF